VLVFLCRSLFKCLIFLFKMYSQMFSFSDSNVLNPLHYMSFYCLCFKEVGEEHPPRAPVGGWVMGRCVCVLSAVVSEPVVCVCADCSRSEEHTSELQSHL